MLAVHPQQFTRRRIQGKHIPPRPAGRIDNTANHQRSAFKPVLRMIPQIVRFESPRNIELIEVRRIDLVKWPISRISQIPAISGPVTIRGRRLPPQRRSGKHNHRRKPANPPANYARFH
jgi:hypothetical protein